MSRATDLATLIAAGASAAAAERVLTNLGGLRGIAKASAIELQQHGIPKRTAERMSAAISLGLRGSSMASESRAIAGHARDIHSAVEERMRGLHQEVFLVVSLDVRNRIVDIAEVARGSVSGVEVHPREVFRAAIRVSAAGIVIVHNHPSGDATPSEEDVELTKRIRGCGTMLGIPAIDHVVIAGDSFRSICEWMGSSW